MSSRLAMGFHTSFSLFFLTKPESTFDASNLIRHVESRDKILLFLGFKIILVYINLFYDLIKNSK
jgi:hypothetical protein